VFFSAWVCCSLAINTVFQAYLTTFLVDPGFEKSITSVDEVFDSGIKYGFKSAFFDRAYNNKTDPSSMKILKNRIDCVEIFKCVLWTVRYKNISTLSISLYMDDLFSDYSDELKDYQFCGLKETPVLVTDMVMTLQKGSPLLGRVDEIIGRLIEGGIATYLQNFNPETKSFSKANPSTSSSLLDEYAALNVSNMQSALFLFLFGHSLGLITFLFEILYFKLHVQDHCNEV
jgi:hypothetical protein